MKVIGFTGDEVQTVYKILATILHLVILDNIKPLLVSLSPAVCQYLCCAVYRFFRQMSVRPSVAKMDNENKDLRMRLCPLKKRLTI